MKSRHKIMYNHNLKCEERIDAWLKERVEDFKKALQRSRKSNTFDLVEWVNEYCLAYGDDPQYRAKRLELSWGGPQDYFLFFEDGTIEYHFLDWFDGAKRTLDGEDYRIMKEFYETAFEL